MLAPPSGSTPMRTPLARIASRSTTATRSRTYASRYSCRCVVDAVLARSSETLATPRRPSARNAFARSSIHRVTWVSAGPPCGGSYLKPPYCGGLCDGVITIPSASPRRRPRLYPSTACDTTGVGVKPSRASTMTSTPLAARTSSAVAKAGFESACVSNPMNRGPSIPACLRWRQIAWVIARMWSSLKAASSEEPRCPEVPNTTRCAATDGSGCRL